MYLMNNIPINALSILMLSVICVYSKKYGETESAQNKIFILLMYVNILLLIVDIFGRLDGYPGTILPVLNQVGNFLVFIFSPVLTSLWLLYVYYFIYKKSKYEKWIFIIVATINIINFIIVVLSLKTGWIYHIDENNVYHRGSLFFIAALIPLFMLAIADLILIKNRKGIGSKHYYALICFSIPPVFFTFLQVVIYGYAFIYNGVALFLLVVFLYVQTQDIFTDYLTGVANRKKLELYLKKMISGSTANQTFSAIMIDLDDFKKINDTLGHKTGDEELQVMAALLKNCIGKKDFIARYGGDEFCIVLNTSNISNLEAIVEKINSRIENYNATSDKPYKSGLSMGYASYQPGMNMEDFLNVIDKLMYINKRNCQGN